jgi:hypothetical protein
LVLVAVGTGVVISVVKHVAFALAWMLISYVAIGLFETLYTLARRLRRRRDVEAAEEPVNPSP